MATSLFKMSEQVQARTGKGEFQEIIEAVRQSFATAVRFLWYENKKNDLSEIDGAFVYTFGKDPAIVPVLDARTNQYYINIPSTYIALPHQMGIVQISYMLSQNVPFVLMANGAWSLFAGLKSSGMGGLKPCYVESNRIYFPEMKADEVGEILLKLSIGVDGVEVDEDLNIPLNVQDQIVEACCNKFNPKPPATVESTLSNG